MMSKEEFKKNIRKGTVKEAILSFLHEHPDAYSIGEIQVGVKAGYFTTYHNLLSLYKDGKLEKGRAGKTILFMLK